MDRDTGSLPIGRRLQLMERDIRRAQEEIVNLRLEMKGLMVKLTLATGIFSFVAYTVVEVLFHK